ncbi:hypothetical protein [Roseimaritima sediminicola]|uniref:hypothetical protein n=1 Tax=Roseimaritima sediminicola TaxID=2662066 RepID=UPI00129857CC|nr:hypothetical protein [Roseimaritima sediminicola]
MPRPPRIQFPGANYHVVTRGDGRRELFHDHARYKAFLVEDAGYYWTLNRYINLNPCSGARPLVADPESWPHSSFAGYARRLKRVDWIAYDQLHTYWKASVGGKDPAAAYRRYVNAGLAAPENPFNTQLREWVFGSEDFLRRMIQLADGADSHCQQSTSRRPGSIGAEEIIAATAAYHGVEPADYAVFRSTAAGRDMAAWLCRRWSPATLRELGPRFGLPGVDSVSNLVRRAERRYQESRQWRHDAANIEQQLHLNTEHKA